MYNVHPYFSLKNVGKKVYIIYGKIRNNEEHLGLQKPLISLSYNPCWFSQPEVTGTLLTGTGTLGWGAWLLREPWQ